MNPAREPYDLDSHDIETEQNCEKMRGRADFVKVWMVSSGEYEQFGLDLIADSREAAIEGVKHMYGPPYKVQWFEEEWGLRGEFKRVLNYSTEHTAKYFIEEQSVFSLGDELP